MCAGASDGTISTQVLAEFWVTVTRKMKTPLSTRSAREQIALLGAFHVLPVDHATVIEAIRIQESHKLSFWDAQIIASARLANGSRDLFRRSAAGRGVRGCSGAESLPDLAAPALQSLRERASGKPGGASAEQ